MPEFTIMKSERKRLRRKLQKIGSPDPTPPTSPISSKMSFVSRRSSIFSSHSKRVRLNSDNPSDYQAVAVVEDSEPETRPSLSLPSDLRDHDWLKDLQGTGYFYPDPNSKRHSEIHPLFRDCEPDQIPEFAHLCVSNNEEARKQLQQLGQLPVQQTFDPELPNLANQDQSELLERRRESRRYAKTPVTCVGQLEGQTEIDNMNSHKLHHGYIYQERRTPSAAPKNADIELLAETYRALLESRSSLLKDSCADLRARGLLDERRRQLQQQHEREQRQNIINDAKRRSTGSSLSTAITSNEPFTPGATTRAGSPSLWNSPLSDDGTLVGFEEESILFKPKEESIFFKPIASECMTPEDGASVANLSLLSPTTSNTNAPIKEENHKNDNDNSSLADTFEPEVECSTRMSIDEALADLRGETPVATLPATTFKEEDAEFNIDAAPAAPAAAAPIATLPATTFKKVEVEVEVAAAPAATLPSTTYGKEEEVKVEVAAVPIATLPSTTYGKDEAVEVEVEVEVEAAPVPIAALPTTFKEAGFDVDAAPAPMATLPATTYNKEDEVDVAIVDAEEEVEEHNEDENPSLQICVDLLTRELAASLGAASALLPEQQQKGKSHSTSALQIWVMIEAYEKLRERVLSSGTEEGDAAAVMFDTWLRALYTIHDDMIAENGGEQEEADDPTRRHTVIYSAFSEDEDETSEGEQENEEEADDIMGGMVVEDLD